jgi:hypothetical protein
MLLSNKMRRNSKSAQLFFIYLSSLFLVTKFSNNQMFSCFKLMLDQVEKNTTKQIMQYELEV